MSDFIHDLIISLSQTEKRYFKLYSGFSSEKDNKAYMILFELIEKQKSYDEEKIKKTYGIKHFAQKKKHLIEKIQESLRHYHQKDNYNNEIDNYIQEGKLLIKRSFYKQAFKALKRAESKAKDAELFTQQIRIKETETDLLRAEGNPDNLQNHIAKLQEELPRLIKKIDQKLEIEKVFLQFVKFNQEIEFIRNTVQEKQLQTLMQSPILKTVPTEFSIITRINFHYIHALNFFMQGDFRRSFEQFRYQKEIFIQNNNTIAEYGAEYTRCIANYAFLAVKSGNIVSDTIVKTLEALEQQKNSNSLQVYYWKYLINLHYLVTVEKYQEAWNWYLVKEKEINQLSAFSLNSSERNYSLFDSSMAGLMLNKNKEVKRNLNQYINNTGIKKKPEAIITARILILLIDLLVNNYSVNDNEIKSVIRLCKENNLFLSFEKYITQFISKYGNCSSLKEKKQLLNELMQEFKQFKKNKFEKNAFALFDFEKWVVGLKLK